PRAMASSPRRAWCRRSRRRSATSSRAGGARSSVIWRMRRPRSPARAVRMSSPAGLEVRVAGRFARETLAAGDGEVCAIFQRSFYLRTAAGFACFGDARLGRGPLNALLDALPAVTMGAKLSASLASAQAWSPPPFREGRINLADARPPDEGFGGLVIGRHNALAAHAQPALEAIDRWLAGNSLDAAAEGLIGLGPGLTP